MLVELLVENYAVVDRIRVRFHPGLNLLTGETGSGKSIVVDAFGLLLGARASPEMIRSGEARARVAGIFDVRDRADVRALLDPAGIAIEDSELLIEREILAGGKSRAFLGSRPVAVSLLRELAPLLGDIHGQHDQQLLFSPDAQRDMLDTFASSGELRTQVAEIYACWKTAGAALETLERTEQEKLRLLDLWEFQRREIEGAAPAAAKTNRSMPSAASCRTSAACRRTPAPPTPRSTIRPKPRWRRCAWPPNGWTMCAASIHRSRSPARLSFGPGGESRPQCRWQARE